jgi:hypothetical protein
VKTYGCQNLAWQPVTENQTNPKLIIWPSQAPYHTNDYENLVGYFKRYWLDKTKNSDGFINEIRALELYPMRGIGF